MNQAEHFIRLNEYNSWANIRVFESIELALFPAAATKVFSHLLGAEFIWKERLKAAFPGRFPEFSAEEMKKHIVYFQEEMEAQIANWSEGQWNEPLEIKNLKGDVFQQTRAEILTHLFNHATYHRGQISLLLRQEDHQPIATDFIFFARIKK